MDFTALSDQPTPAGWDSLTSEQRFAAIQFMEQHETYSFEYHARVLSRQFHVLLTAHELRIKYLDHLMG